MCILSTRSIQLPQRPTDFQTNLCNSDSTHHFLLLLHFGEKLPCQTKQFQKRSMPNRISVILIIGPKLSQSQSYSMNGLIDLNLLAHKLY